MISPKVSHNGLVECLLFCSLSLFCVYMCEWVCTCMHVKMKVKGQWLVSSLVALHLIFWRESLIEPRGHKLSHTSGTACSRDTLLSAFPGLGNSNSVLHALHSKYFTTKPFQFASPCCLFFIILNPTSISHFEQCFRRGSSWTLFLKHFAFELY